MPNMEKRVFTRGGKPILKATLRHAFDKAVGQAKFVDGHGDKAMVEDFQFRDFRHCARTRWADASLPFEVGEIGIGHKIRGVAGRYINLTDNQIRRHFSRCSEG